MSDKVKVVNKKTNTIIEVPFAHAIEVLLPQGNYKMVDETLKEAISSPVNRETGESNFDMEALKISRASMCDILDRAEIKYPGNANKAELLDIIKKHKLVGANI